MGKKDNKTPAGKEGGRHKKTAPDNWERLSVKLHKCINQIPFNCSIFLGL